MENDTAHALNEFDKFPWDRLTDAVNWRDNDPEDPTTEFQVTGISAGGVVGGVVFHPHHPHIDFIRGDGSVDAWAIPDALGEFVAEHHKRGGDERASEIKKQARELAVILFGKFPVSG